MDIIDICNKIYNTYTLLNKIDKNLKSFLNKFDCKYVFRIEANTKELLIFSSERTIELPVDTFATFVVFYNELEQYYELTEDEKVLYEIIGKVIKKNEHILRKKDLIELFSTYDKLVNLKYSIILRVDREITLELQKSKIWIESSPYIFDFLLTEKTFWITINKDKLFVGRIIYNFREDMVELSTLSEKVVDDIIEILKSRFKTLRKNTYITHKLSDAIEEINKLMYKTIFYIMCLKDIIDEVMKSNNPKLMSLFI